MTEIANPLYPKSESKHWLKAVLAAARPRLSETTIEKERGVYIGDLLSDVRVNAKRISVYVIIGLLLGTLYFIAVPHKYSVNVTLVPIPQWLSSQPQPIGGGLSSLLQSTSVDLSTLFETSLQDKAVYEDLDKKMQARQFIFSNMWDDKTKTWHQPSGLLGAAGKITSGIKALAGFPAWHGPTIDDLRITMTNSIKVTRNADTSILVEMKSRQPEVTRAMLAFVVQEADERVSAQMVKYVDQTIYGLQSQINQANEATLRDSLIQKLTAEMAIKASLQNNRIMTLNFSAPEISDTPIYPSLKGTLAIGFLLGLLFPAGWILILRASR